MGLGAVHDELGRGIPGVEILVFALGGPSAAPAVTLVSDERGRFSLENLRPGNFLLALNKPGYSIRLAQANSRLLSFLQIRMEENGASPDIGKARDDPMGWVLRMPRSDVLKEETSKVTGDSGASASGPLATRAGPLPVRTELSQWYTSSLPGAADSQGMGSTGRSTNLQVRGDLPGKGDWEVRGLTESLSTAGQDDVGRYDQGANRLRLAMQYHLTPADSLQVQARFDRDRLRADADVDAALPASQAVRTLGYHANWARSIGEDSGLDVAMGFLDARARLPAPAESTAPQEVANELRDWNWNARAGYHFPLSQDHHLSVAARTRYHSYDESDQGWMLTPVRGELTVLDMGRRGWGVTLSGEDSWQLTKPLSLILGMDTHYSEYGERSMFVVPKVGARRQGDHSMVQGWVLFWAEPMSSAGARGDSGGQIGADGVGFRAEILQKLPGEWMLGGHVERNPAGGDLLEDPGLAGIGRAQGMVMTDATAWSQGAGISVSKSLKGIEGSLESDHGRIVGRVAGGIEEMPVLVLETGDLRYLALKVSANVEKTDTQVRLDYTRLAGQSAELDESAPPSASRIDLLILQPIPFVSNRGAGTWKVLFGYQSLSTVPTLATDADADTPSERIHRFSGGIGVTF